MESRLLFSRSKTDRTDPGGVLFCRTKQKHARTHTRCENWHLFPSVYGRPATSHEALQFPVGKNLTSFSFNENALAAWTAGKHVLSSPEYTLFVAVWKAAVMLLLSVQRQSQIYELFVEPAESYVTFSFSFSSAGLSKISRMSWTENINMIRI